MIALLRNRKLSINLGRIMKVFSWLVSIILALVVAGFLFVYFSPDYDMRLVRSESMEPAINMGDVVVIGPPGGPLIGEIEEGSVVTYHRGQDLVTHRVLSVEGNTLLTKGDAVEDVDPWPVSRNDVRGVYMFKIPGIGYFQNFIRTRPGWVVLIIVPTGVLVALLIREIRKRLRGSPDVAG